VLSAGNARAPAEILECPPLPTSTNRLRKVQAASRRFDRYFDNREDTLGRITSFLDDQEEKRRRIAENSILF
jgi:hypothetical protein